MSVSKQCPVSGAKCPCGRRSQEPQQIHKLSVHFTVHFNLWSRDQHAGTRLGPSLDNYYYPCFPAHVV